METMSTVPQGSCPFRLGGDGRSNAEEAALLRDVGPASEVELPGGMRARAVVDYPLAQRLLRSGAVSRSAYLHCPGFADGTRQVDGVTRNWIGTRNALNSYGTAHTRLRAPIAAALNRRRIESMVPAIEALADALLSKIAADSACIVDARSDYAQPLPAQVNANLLGIPADLQDPFFLASAGLFDTSASPVDAAAHMAAMVELLDQLVEEKRAHPADDLTSDLIRICDESASAFSDVELRDQLMLLVSAGTETTVNSIGNLLVGLMAHPEQLHLVQTGTVGLEEALEESLRHQSPIANVPLRFAVERIQDVPTGEEFAEGEPILVNFAAAGRDPAVHGPDADSFDISRATSRQHLGFGHGTHFCPGAPLARRETLIAVRKWLERFPGSSLATPEPEVQRLRSIISNGYAVIPIRRGPQRT